VLAVSCSVAMGGSNPLYPAFASDTFAKISAVLSCKVISGVVYFGFKDLDQAIHIGCLFN